jgi:ethanolamine transporter
MRIDQIIMYIMAGGVLLGGIDCILGNKWGYGEKFENGFRLLGPVGLSMAGIICLAPLLSVCLGGFIRPLCAALHMDPGIFGSILAIDMGGYQLAMDLTENPELGRFSAVILSSVFGCTVVFTIPVGLEAITAEDYPYFTKGILLGFAAMPFAILTGGVLLGLGIGQILWNCLPILLLSLALSIGVIMKPDVMMKGFRFFSRIIKIIATLGLTLAAMSHLTGITLIPSMPPLLEAMETVSSICIVMLGSMPLAELIQRIMKVPFARIREKTGLNGVSTTALLLGMVSTTPTLAMIPDMDKRGKVLCSACLVSYVGLFSAHLAFAMQFEPDMIPALLAAKTVGAIIGGTIALLSTRNTTE